MNYAHDLYLLQFDVIVHVIWKYTHERLAHIAFNDWVSQRVTRDIVDELVDGVEELGAQPRSLAVVPLTCSNVLIARRPGKVDRQHQCPNAARASARTTSAGISFSLPFSI